MLNLNVKYKYILNININLKYFIHIQIDPALSECTVHVCISELKLTNMTKAVTI